MTDLELVLSTLGTLDRKVDKLGRKLKALDRKVGALGERVEVIGLESRVRDGELAIKLNALVDTVTDLRNEYRAHVHTPPE